MSLKHRLKGNRKPLDKNAREYIALQEVSERFHSYRRLLLWSAGGLIYCVFCGVASAHLGPFRLVDAGLLVFLTESGYSLLGGLCLIMTPLLLVGWLTAKRELKNATACWLATDP